MARLKIVYTLDVRFRAPRHSGMELDAFLDMLRYDRCKVTSWRQDGPEYVVSLAKDETDFTLERWSSFGIRFDNHATDLAS
jgi:hypothetical protein